MTPSPEARAGPRYHMRDEHWTRVVGKTFQGDDMFLHMVENWHSAASTVDKKQTLRMVDQVDRNSFCVLQELPSALKCGSSAVLTKIIHRREAGVYLKLRPSPWHATNHGLSVLRPQASQELATIHDIERVGRWNVGLAAQQALGEMVSGNRSRHVMVLRSSGAQEEYQ